MSQTDLIHKINNALPQTQCEKCGYPGCLPYATAIVKQGAAINRCQPGGSELIGLLSDLSNRPEIPPYHTEPIPIQIAQINEDECIGCMLCIKACPVDAIIGSSKQLHTVLTEACTGCGLCLPPCPTSCISFYPVKSDMTNHTHKLIYKTRYENKKTREEKNQRHQLRKHFALTDKKTIQQTLAHILNHDPS